LVRNVTFIADSFGRQPAGFYLQTGFHQTKPKCPKN